MTEFYQENNNIVSLQIANARQTRVGLQTQPHQCWTRFCTDGLGSMSYCTTVRLPQVGPSVRVDGSVLQRDGRLCTGHHSSSTHPRVVCQSDLSDYTATALPPSYQFRVWVGPGVIWQYGLRGFNTFISCDKKLHVIGSIFRLFSSIISYQISFVYCPTSVFTGTMISLGFYNLLI